jgi:hypothetical protein
MAYEVCFHEISGRDGGTLKGGFDTIEAARDWAKASLSPEEHTQEVVDIRDEETDEQVEVLFVD